MTVARGFIVKRGEAYRIAVELPSDLTTGKRQRHWETFHGTKKESDKKLTELQGLVDHARLAANSKMTLSEFLAVGSSIIRSRRPPRPRTASGS